MTPRPHPPGEHGGRSVARVHHGSGGVDVEVELEARPAQLTEAVNDSERAASEVAGLARQSAQAAHKGGEIVFVEVKTGSAGLTARE